MKIFLFNSRQKILAQRMPDKILDASSLVLVVWKDLSLSGKEDRHFGGAVG